MTDLFIESTFKTPEIRFEKSSGTLVIRGRVFPENPNSYFQPILNWLSEYHLEPAPETRLVLFLTYFNSASNEYLFRCCKKIESLALDGKPASIVWEFEAEDEDMKQLGEDFAELLKINFELKAIS